MAEDLLVRPYNVQVATDLSQPSFKTFIDSSGEFLFESLRHSLKQNTEQHCDLKLYCTDSRFIRVHRSLFAAISPFLRSLILDLDPFETKELCIFLPDIRYVDLQHIVSLVYTGKIYVTKRTRGTVVKWLEILGIPMVLSEESVSVSGEETRNDIIYVHDELQKHRKEKRMCQLCKKSFKTESYMKSHLLTHTGEKPHKCDHCGKQYRYKDSLKAHIRDHTGEKFQCQTKSCDKEFNRRRDLKDHENIHLDDREAFNLACSICETKFLKKKQLSNHMEVHRITVDPCGICGKVLKNVACLRSHMRNHTTPKNFSCGTCGKAFKRNFDLTVHLRIHNGSKPYCCDVCKKTFSLSSTLAKHKRFHDKLGKLKRKNSTTVNEEDETHLDAGVSSVKKPTAVNDFQSDKVPVSTKETELDYISHNTIADALIDLSQSSNTALSSTESRQSHPRRDEHSSNT